MKRILREDSGRTGQSVVSAPVAVLVLAACIPVSAQGPVHLGPDSQLFVDDHLIASKSGMTRKAHPGKKLPKPVLEATEPWEGQRVYVLGTVAFDPVERRYRMWYMSRIGPGHGNPAPELVDRHGDIMMHATSRDGVRWDKPVVGRFEFNGSRDNNIVLFDVHSPSIHVDPDDKQEPFRLVAWSWRKPGQGFCTGTSQDGLTWKFPAATIYPSEQSVLEIIALTRDPKTGEYLAFLRLWKDVRGFRRRILAVTASKDFQNWSEPEPILVPDEQDDVWATGPEQRTEFYGMAGFPYGGQYLGFVPVFRVERMLTVTGIADNSRWDGPLDGQLVHSRDGRKWDRLEDRSPVIPRGEAGSFDAGCILHVSNPPVAVGDEVWVYYTAVTTKHGGTLPEKKISIGRISWPRDRFVSLDAGTAGGTVETLPVVADGRQLEVNADVRKGSLRVEVLSADGQPLPGFTAGDCVRITGDRLRHVVRWRGHRELPPGRPVKLRFSLVNGSIYSYRLVDRTRTST